jgi:hypothetical protein
MADAGTDGAVAAATYFLDLYEVVGGGDLAEWKAVSHPECVFCEGVSDEVERMVSVGHRQEGPEITVNSVEPTEITPGAFYSVLFDVIQGPYRELDAQGVLVKENSSPTPFTIDVIVVRENGQWLVRAGQPEAK